MHRSRFFLVAVMLFGSGSVLADIGRVYHPYVERHEFEFEYGSALRDVNGDSVYLQRAGVGYAWTDRLFTEAYFLTEAITHEGDEIRGYEVELLWQLTEQGEYWADWGVLVEAATADDIRRHEVALGLVWEKELASRWVATLNAIVEYEYGSDIVSELETALRGQLRYRNNIAFEPAIEFYLDDQDWAMGPAIMGAQTLTIGKRLKWELGLLFGLDEKTPSTNLRLNIEFEF